MAARLRAAGCVYADDEAALLVAACDGDGDRLAGLVARRVAGEPLETVLGWVDFGGLRLVVEPGVFVPRRRSALLLEQAAALTAPDDVVVDLCCGCGALGAALRARHPGIELHAADADPVAVRVARRNLGEGTATYCGDLFAALPAGLRGRIGVVVANVPYVPSGAIAFLPAEARDHEPRAALDGGPDGLDVVRRVLAAGRSWVRPGGHVLVETSRPQAPAVVTAAAERGWEASVVVDDALEACCAVFRAP